MHGFVVIDKPAGITSHDVVSRVRRIMGTRKVGHTGTLDPFATGVLPVAINDGTKSINFLDEGFKHYEAVMHLGVTTDTLDMTGAVLSEADPGMLAPETIHSVCSRFTGNLTQIPPMYSALKKDGQPLYKLARQGVEVERQPRDIQIYSLEIIDITMPLVTIRVACSRGTYVRTLADDIGRDLECGAALQELRRTASGLFTIEKSVTLEQLEIAVKGGLAAKYLISPFESLGHLPDIRLKETGVKKLSFGVAPDWTDTESDTEHIQHCAVPTLVRLFRLTTLAAVAEVVPQPDALPKITLKRVFV